MANLAASGYIADMNQPPIANGLPSQCSLCNSPNIMSVLAIQAAGTSSTTGASLGIGGGKMLGGGPVLLGGGVGVSSQKTKSDLVKMLEFPLKPPVRRAYALPSSGSSAPFFGCLAIALPVTILALLFIKDSGLQVAAIGGGIAVGTLIAAVSSAPQRKEMRERHVGDEARHNAEQQALVDGFARSQEAYQRLYYCAQCHHVFDPATGKTARADSLASIF